MAAQAETDVVGIELEKVHKTVAQLFEREGPFIAAIKKKQVEIMSYRQMRIGLKLRPGGKFGFFNPELGDMGRGSGSRYDKAVLSPLSTKYAVEYTTLTEWATDSDKKAVINAVQEDFADAMEEYMRYLDSMAVGAGDGVVGTVETATSQTDLTLDNTWGVKLLRYGQSIHIYNSTLTTLRTTSGSREINLHDLANRRITIDAAAAGTVVAGDKIVVDGLTATPPVGIKGVKYHHSNASTGSWLGFDRSLTPEIRANRVNGGAVALNLAGPRLAVDLAMDRVGKSKKPKMKAWTHPAQEAAYEALGFLVTQIGATGEGKGLDLYFGGTKQLAGCVMETSYNWDRKRIDFVNLDYWGRGELHPAGIYKNKKGGHEFELRGGSGGVAAGWIYYIVSAFDLFVTNPAGCSYEDNLAVPDGY